MRYCPECASEYNDDVKTCADCPPGTALITADEMKTRGIPLPGEADTRKFVVAGTAEDPLTSEQLVGLLDQQGIPVFARPRRSGTVDTITGGSQPWWEILVPEETVARATDIITKEKARLDATADEAARAAEEESIGSTGEKP